MKYQSIIDKRTKSYSGQEPPYSIPGIHLPKIDVYDDLVSDKFHQVVWDYLLNSQWHHKWVSPPDELQLYKPSDWDDSWINSLTIRRTLTQPRALFASDEYSLKTHHPIIYHLWKKINNRLDNKWTIAGIPEGTHFKDYPCPPTQDPALKPGWRVYANASPHDMICGNGYIHRDNKDLLDEKTATIIWMASPKWYPSWSGEIVFYPEDPEGLTGDYQQFNSETQQQRKFQIGWPDSGKLVSLKPNRLLVYDGRTLHSTNSSKNMNNTEFHRRIVFRARLKE